MVIIIDLKWVLYNSPLKDGVCHLSMSDLKIPVVVDSVVEVRIVPATGCYVIKVVYEKTEQPQIQSIYVAGIDLGIDQFSCSIYKQACIQYADIKSGSIVIVSQ